MCPCCCFAVTAAAPVNTRDTGLIVASCTLLTFVRPNLLAGMSAVGETRFSARVCVMGMCCAGASLALIHVSTKCKWSGVIGCATRCTRYSSVFSHVSRLRVDRRQLSPLNANWDSQMLDETSLE